MTRDEFQKRFSGRMLLFLTEAWNVRKLAPQDLGLYLDNHARELRGLLGEMYDAMNRPVGSGTDTAPEPPPPTAAANGHPRVPPRAKT